MTVRRFIGSVGPAGQLTRGTPSAPSTGYVYAIKCGGTTASYTAVAGDTLADVIDGLVAAIGLAGREFSDISASNNADTYIDLESADPGTPFTVSDASGGPPTITGLTSPVTSPTGPNWLIAANFDPSGLPTGTDTVIFEDSDVDLLWGLEDIVSDTGLIFVQYSTHTGKIGLPETNASGFPEYRPQFLKATFAQLSVGLGEGSGSPLIKIDGDAHTSVDLRVYKTGSVEDDQEPAAFQFQNATGITADVSDGTLCFAPFGSVTTTFTTLRVTGGTVTCEVGCTFGSIECGGSGTVISEADMTNVTMYGGTVRVLEAADITGTCKIYAGTLDHQSEGDIGTLDLDGATAVADFSNTIITGCGITTLTFGAGRFHDPNRRTTVSTFNGFSSFRSG